MEPPPVMTVSDLQRKLRMGVESSWPRLAVAGELSNFTAHRGSGHLYFTLKDAQAQLRCVMWRDQVRRVRFAPKEGQAVIASGRMTVYERGGQLQMSVVSLELAGLGAQEEALRRLKEKLRDEGATADERKRTLPFWPGRIGIVTSPHAAALRDVVRTILRRDPTAQLLISPTPVQGKGAGSEIARALDRVDRTGRCDVILLVRGGGSIEDLWSFNEEVVARAILGCSVPVVSGVGHETDTTVVDLVSDRVGSTPTAAAELSVPVRSEVEQRWLALENRLRRGLTSAKDAGRGRLLALTTRLREPTAMIHRRAQRLDGLMVRADRVLARRLQDQRNRLAALEQRLQKHAPTLRLAALRTRLTLLERLRDDRLAHVMESKRTTLARGAEGLTLLNPLAVLARGYAVVRDEAGAAIRGTGTLKVGDEIKVRLHEGALEAEIKRVIDT